MMSSDSSTASALASWTFAHAAIRVPDFDAAVAWYTEKLGFRLVDSAPLKEKTYGFLVSQGGAAAFSIELIAGAGAMNRPAYHDLGSSLDLTGLHHLAFGVGSVDESVAELRSRGVHVVSEPHDVPQLRFRVSFFADPWGNLFEVIEGLTSREAVERSGSKLSGCTEERLPEDGVTPASAGGTLESDRKDPVLRLCKRVEQKSWVGRHPFGAKWLRHRRFIANR